MEDYERLCAITPGIDNHGDTSKVASSSPPPSSSRCLVSYRCIARRNKLINPIANVQTKAGGILRGWRMAKDEFRGGLGWDTIRSAGFSRVFRVPRSINILSIKSPLGLNEE